MEILFYIALIVYLIYLGNKVSHLQDEVDHLTGRYSGSSHTIPTIPKSSTTESHKANTATSTPHSSIPVPTPPKASSFDNAPSLSRLVNWYQRDWPLKTGGLLLLIGFGWLVSYAFIQNWIGPYARVILGFIAGAAGMALGTAWLRRDQLQGNILVVIGIGIEFLTIWAASVKYGYFPIEFAYAIILVLIGYVAWLAVRYNTENIAIEANIIGGIAPFLIRTPDLPFTTHIIYLLLLTVGLVWLVSYKGWRTLLLSATAVVFVTSLAHIPNIRFTGDEIQINELAFSMIAFLLFYASALVVTLTHKTLSRADLGTLVLNTAFISLWISLSVPTDLRGVISLLITIVYLVGTAAVYMYTKNKHHIFIHASISMLMLTITALYELEGPVLTIALILFSTTYSGLSSYLLDKAQYVVRASFLLIIPLLMEFNNLFSRWTDEEFFEYTLLSLAFSAAFAYMTHIVFKLYKKNHNSVDLGIIATYAYTSSFFLLMLVWKYSHLIIENVNIARGAALLIYAILGVFAYVIGRNYHEKYVRYFGGALIGFVALRLLFVETATMSIAGKIVTFIVVGLIFISTIFFEKSKTK